MEYCLSKQRITLFSFTYEMSSVQLAIPSYSREAMLRFGCQLSAVLIFRGFQSISRWVLE